MLTSCQHMRQMELVQEIGGREWSVALFTAKINIPNQFYNLVCGHKIFLFSFFENDIMCKHETGKIFILDFRMFHLLLVFLISQTVLQLDTFTQKCSQIISYTPECISEKKLLKQLIINTCCSIIVFRLLIEYVQIQHEQKVLQSSKVQCKISIFS